jgi:outer membrane lipoprotein SlyB
MHRALFDELLKLGAISDEQARRSLDRLDSLERSKPNAKQVGRYGAIGGVGGAVIGGVGNAFEHGSAFKGTTVKAKALNATANAVKGALSGGAIPLLRSHMDQRAEVGTLRKYMSENQ